MRGGGIGRPSTASRDNLTGIALIVLSMAAFAIEDALIKAASAHVPPGQIIVTIGLGGTAIFGTRALMRGVPLFGPALRNPMVLLRNLGEMLGTGAFVTALATAPISLVTAIVQANPLLVTLGAAVFLREKVGPRRWAAVLIGLCGVIVILRPWGAGFTPASLFAVAGVICLSVRDLATRRVPQGIPTYTLLVYAFVAITPGGILLLLLGQPPVWPEPFEAALLAGCVAVGGVAYYTVTAAMRIGDISVVTPFRYSRLVFGIGLGIAVFGERPDAVTYVGAGVVVATGLYTLWREALTRQ